MEKPDAYPAQSYAEPQAFWVSLNLNRGAHPSGSRLGQLRAEHGLPGRLSYGAHNRKSHTRIRRRLLDSGAGLMASAGTSGRGLSGFTMERWVFAAVLFAGRRGLRKQP